MPTRNQRMEGGIIGLLVGDALGVPYEFHPASDMPRFDLIEFEPPAGFRRTHARIPVGTWSDDGAHALCLLASLLHRGVLDVEDFARRLINWRDWGYLAVGFDVFDVGIQTERAISNLRAGTPARIAGPSGERDNGNGALMRSLPLALWHRGSDAELVADADAQSCVTHGHLRSRLCCGLYCLWARKTLEGTANPWQAAVAGMRTIHSLGTAGRRDLDDVIRPDDDPRGTGSGYVLDSLHSARLAATEETYERVVRKAVALGNDTDTTACIAGGIAGVRFGIDAIPARWRDALRERNVAMGLMAQLTAS